MRKTNILFVLMLSAITWLQAQSTNITGTWKMDWTKVSDAMSQTEKDKFNALPEQTRSRVTNSFSSRTFTFAQDGTVTIEWQGANGAASESGTWNVDGNALTIMINNTSRSYTISENTGSLTLSTTPGPNAMFSTLILNRQ